MGVQIEDPRKLLSKHQIQRVKTAVASFLGVEDGRDQNLQSFLVKEVLPNIHFAEGTEDPYNRVSYRTDEATGHVLISFSYQSKVDLKERLRTRLKVHTSMRKVSEDTESELWKRYAFFKKYTKANIRVPTPTEVKKERPIFEQLLETIPNSDFKKYIQDCL